MTSSISALETARGRDEEDVDVDEDDEVVVVALVGNVLDSGMSPRTTRAARNR